MNDQSETPATVEPRGPNLNLTNSSAVRQHAIKVSMETRAGRFTRVSQDFLDTIEAALAAKCIELEREARSEIGVRVAPGRPAVQFLTTRGKKRVLEAVALWLVSETHRETKAVRVGKTF